MSEEKNENEEGMVEMSLDNYLYATRPDNIFLGDYDDPNVLFGFLQDLNDSKTTPRRIVYINSNGGYLDFVNPIIDALEIGDCELVASGRILSAGFLTFFASNVERRILPKTIGMFHYPFIFGAKLRPDNSFDTGHTELSKLDSKMKLPYEEYFRELLDIDKQRHKELMKGEELIYDDKKLRKLLKKSNKILAQYKK